MLHLTETGIFIRSLRWFRRRSPARPRYTVRPSVIVLSRMKPAGSRSKPELMGIAPGTFVSHGIARVASAHGDSPPEVAGRYRWAAVSKQTAWGWQDDS